MKVNKLLLMFLLCLPFTIFADGCGDNPGKIANSYITGENKYIYTSGDYKGGLLTENEFKKTYNDNDYTYSYLFTGSNYCLENKKTIDETLSSVLTDKAMVSEYVRSETKVKGNGTYSNPWYFPDVYSITLNVISEDGTISEKNDNITDKKTILTLNLTSNETKDIFLQGSYISNSCGFSVTDNKMTIKNVKSNLNCNIYFGIKYTLSYDCNGGNDSIDDTTFACNDPNVTISNETCSKDGFDFKGWSIIKDGDTITETKINTIFSTCNDHTLYAKWEKATCDVAFMVDNNTYETITQTIDSTFSLPTNNPTKTGYIFDGWFTQETGGTQITTSTTNACNNITLYAHFSEAPHTLTFNPNGGSVTPASKELMRGEAYGTLPIPTYSDSSYYFVGWFYGTNYNSKEAKSTDVMGSSNRTLYAHWYRKKTLTFDPNGGSVSPTSKLLKTGEEYGELPTPTYDSNHVFKAWYTKKNGGTKVTSSTLMGNYNTTIYAYYSSLIDEPKAIILDDTTMYFVYDKYDYIIGETFNGKTITDVIKIVDSEFGGGCYSVTTVDFALSFYNYHPTTTKEWFWGYQSLESIKNINYLNTSNVTDMSGMFSQCGANGKLTISGLSSWDTSKVTSMADMFDMTMFASNTTLDLSNWNISNVTNFSTMFQAVAPGVSGFKINIKNWNPNYNANLSDMFFAANVSKVYCNNRWSNRNSYVGSLFEGAFSLYGSSEWWYDMDYYSSINFAYPGGAFTSL